ncbi:MAG TPA: glycoside hydrolase 100 family protein [Acidimicrobiia bacterium]|nr:glycoside hydrolase 100 family protein [Acidimicrobiia bacterium]
MSHEEGYERAAAVVRNCETPAGFVASPTSLTNYNRVWSRDGAIISLAALMTGEDDLVDCARRTFETLAEYQGPHGEIPSNVDVETQRVSYGGTAGRVDANLWFIIGSCEYWRATGNDDFIETMLPALERARFLLGAWEFNTRGLLYVPLTGDWSDEYLQHGYVLYDQALYLQALTSLGAVHSHVHDSEDHALIEKIGRLRHLIRANYWFDQDAEPTEDTYHEAMFRKGREAASKRDGRYWMPYFAPTGYGYRFDGFANVLVSLIGIADDEAADAVDEYVDGLLDPDMPVMPAFHPAIDPVDEDWEDLQMTFSYEFRNRPYEYHNGGLWPMISGFHVASLAGRGKGDRAQEILDGIHKANALPVGDEDSWGFPEYVHGQRHVGGGTPLQGWSASAAVMGKHALDGQTVFRINTPT